MSIPINISDQKQACTAALFYAKPEQIKTQLDVQEKVIDQLQLTLKKTFSIKAPYSGIITEVHIQEGQQIIPGVPIFSIAKTNQVEVEFFVLAKDYPSTKLGNTIQIIWEKLLPDNV